MTAPDDTLPLLDDEEQRVLGSLLEKQRAVPASYPLTAHALRTACNQTSSREPVVDYDERTVHQATLRLRDRGLLRTVWVGAGTRTVKYHQLVEQVLELSPAECAVLTVLLLRGPQTPGELKTRTERLHRFADREEVQACLRDLGGRVVPVVVELERRPGQQDRRWAHLFGPVPESGSRQGPGTGGSGSAHPAVDRESVLAAGADERDRRVPAGYDAVAADYADRFGDELAGKPFERWLLERTVQLAGAGPIADVGCGPGQLTAFLSALGAVATGVDLSPGMISQARARYPELSFEVGDLTRLLRPQTAAGWGAVLAWYSLVHLAESELPAALAALVRVLTPGGWLNIGLHLGDEVRHVSDWWGTPVTLDFVLHDQDRLLAAVAAAGLQDIEWYRRGPLAGETTERIYILGRRA